MKMDKVIPTIYCTTITTYRNTKSNEVFKEKVEGENIVTDVTVQVSPKGLDIMQKVMNSDNKKPKP